MGTTRSGRRWHGPTWRLAILGACLCAGGCVGPKAITHTRIRYNEVYRSTNDEQLLLNIVRLRYADSPVFIDLPTITSQFEFRGGTSYSGGLDGQGPGRTNLGFGELSLADTPTLSYRPREGKELARSLLTPLSTELLRLVTSGANTEQLLVLAVNDVNDLPNGTMSTLMMPESPDDNFQFRQGVLLLTRMIQNDQIELSSSTAEDQGEASDPIPTSAIDGKAMVEAAKEGFVFRTSGEGRMTLRKREKGLTMRVRPAFVGSPEAQQLEQIFRLTPGLSQYRIKSELSEEEAPRALGDDTIYLNMRSILQVATFMSKGVCVPAEHVACGIAPTTPGPDGRPYDWTRLTAGLFFVHSGKKHPRDAEVAVHYRDRWFWIAGDDVRSRASLAIFELLFALQETNEGLQGPLLTLPIGG